MLVVQKYGGSSVADVPRLKQVAARVARTVAEGHQVVVVVSAMGNTTSELLALAREVSEAPRRRELDLLISVGERVSMTLLAMAITDLGVPAASFTGSQSGIITDEQHVNARVLEVRPHRIREALDQGKVAIVAGFQGVSRTREVTTLGRGGSDTTAVVLAAALGAAWCEICSDVDGVYTADPRLVPGARRLDTLPLDAAQALTEAGAKVLQAEAVAKARALGVELRATATASPPGTGTRLPPGPVPREVLGVTGDARVERWRGPRPLLLAAGSSLRRLDRDASGEWALVDLRNLHDLPRAPDLTREVLGALTAVGGAVLREAELLQACLGILEGLSCEAWWVDATGITALIPRERLAEGERRLHALLVEGDVGDGPRSPSESG